LLGCFALSPRSQAVVPAPDGAYPGGNTAEGQAALLSLTTGGFNTAVGFLSLRSDSTNSFNTAVGAGTLLANVADENTATGAGALLSNTTGNNNTANGAFALFFNTTGGSNTANGSAALFSNITGNVNIAVSLNGLSFNTTGGGNTAIGGGALANSTTGNDNTAVGVNAGSGVTTASNVIAIGTAGNDVNDSCYIGNIFGATSSNGVGVLVNSNGRLGTMTSSRRFKAEIKPMDKVSEALLALKPVTFRYKKEIDPAGTTQFGLVAEDVEKVNPALVVRDKEGRPYSVRYDQVNAMLLNEFLKEHRAFIEEQHKVEQQQEEIDVLKNELKDQRALIQKVSDRIELSTAAQQVVINEP
jgi:hypothetical protein